MDKIQKTCHTPSETEYNLVVFCKQQQWVCRIYSISCVKMGRQTQGFRPRLACRIQVSPQDSGCLPGQRSPTASASVTWLGMEATHNLLTSHKVSLRVGHWQPGSFREDRVQSIWLDLLNFQGNINVLSVSAGQSDFTSIILNYKI